MIAMAALARSWGQMAGLVVVGGIAMTSATNLWLARAIGGRRIGLAFGIKQSGGPAAAMPAGLAVPTLATVVGWRWTFAAFGVFALVGTLSVPRSSLGGTGRSAPSRLGDRRDRWSAHFWLDLRPLVLGGVAGRGEPEPPRRIDADDQPVAEPPRLWAVTTDSPVSPAASGVAIGLGGAVGGARLRARRSRVMSVQLVGSADRARIAAIIRRMHPTLDNEPGVGAWRLRKSQEATRRLLDAAVEVFGERGFEAARVSEVARRCGLTSGAIYARWPSKRDLFLDVIAYVIPQRMVFMVGNAEMPVAERFATLGTNLLSSSGHGFRNVTLEAFVAARRDEPLAEAVSQFLEAEADAIAAMISEGKESGSIDPSLSTDAMVLLCQALGLGTHLALSVGSRGRPAPTADEWNSLIMRIIGAVAVPRPGDPS